MINQSISQCHGPRSSRSRVYIHTKRHATWTAFAGPLGDTDPVVVQMSDDILTYYPGTASKIELLPVVLKLCGSWEQEDHITGIARDLGTMNPLRQPTHPCLTQASIRCNNGAQVI